jgi:hypothetical protein
MQLDELGMALPALLIAAVMDLLEPNSEPHRKALHARLARQARRHRPGPRTNARRLEQRWRHRPRPKPTTDAWASHPMDREGITPVLTCGDHQLPHHDRRGAAIAGRRPEAHRSTQQGPPATPSGALCSTGAAIPLPAVALLASRTARR